MKIKFLCYLFGYLNDGWNHQTGNLVKSNVNKVDRFFDTLTFTTSTYNIVHTYFRYTYISNIIMFRK